MAFTKQTPEERNAHLWGSVEAVPLANVGEFRIVKEKRGELIIGFRVQEMRFMRCTREYDWRNCGRRVYTIEAARDLKEHTIRQRELRMLPAPEFVTVE